MKHVVTVDSIFDTMRIEASICGANAYQVEAIKYLESISAQIEEEFDPFRKAEVDVTYDGINLRILLWEADAEGNLIVNGEWARITVYPHGDMAMTTSHDPEWIEVYEARQP